MHVLVELAVVLAVLTSTGAANTTARAVAPLLRDPLSGPGRVLLQLLGLPLHLEVLRRLVLPLRSRPGQVLKRLLVVGVLPCSLRCCFVEATVLG